MSLFISVHHNIQYEKVYIFFQACHGYASMPLWFVSGTSGTI